MLRLVLILMLACSLARAEEKKDPQSAFEPRGKPGAGQKLLERYVGEWTVVKSFFPRNGDPVKSTGNCTQTMIHDGRYLRSEFTFQQGETKTTGTGMVAFDPESELFTTTWIDSRGTKLSLRQSEEKFNGSEIALSSKALDSKESRRSKTVTKIEADNSKITHRQMSIAADGTERLIMELVLTRK